MTISLQFIPAMLAHCLLPTHHKACAAIMAWADRNTEGVNMFSADWKGYRTLAWVLQGMLAIAIVVVLIQGKWLPALTLGGFLLVSFLFVKLEHKLPTLFDLL